MTGPVAVEFEAELRQVKSMADHTCNVTLNVPEYCLPQVQTMLAWLQEQVTVIVAKTGIDAKQTEVSDGRKGRKR